MITTAPGWLTADALNDVCWQSLLLGQNEKALAACDRAHGLAPTDLYIEKNRAHALLLVGRADDAKVIYLAHEDQTIADEDSKKWQSFVLEDFATFEKANIKNAGFSSIADAMREQSK